MSMLRSSLLGLELSPVGEHLLGSAHTRVGENMRVSSLDFVADGLTHLPHLEGVHLGRQLGMKDDLKEQVAELFAQRTKGASIAHPVHLVQNLVGLLNEVGLQSPDVLLPVPR